MACGVAVVPAVRTGGTLPPTAPPTALPTALPTAPPGRFRARVSGRRTG